MSELELIIIVGTSTGAAAGLTYGYYVMQDYYKRIKADRAWENDPTQRPHKY